MSAEGARLFAQYAYPPNELGHCGPPGADGLLAGKEDEIARRARAFEGAWTYLEALSAATGIADPLDVRLVEAYWAGNELVDEVDPGQLVAHLERRFAGQIGGSWRDASARATAHHSFQVFEVYPWVGLLRAGRPARPAVQVLDDCRVRVGLVLERDGESVVVSNRRLVWDGSALVEGAEARETARWSVDGAAMIAAPSPGDLVALHWDWVCVVLTDAQAGEIRLREESTMRGVSLTPAG